MGTPQVEDNLAEPVWTFDPNANPEGGDADVWKDDKGESKDEGGDDSKDTPDDTSSKTDTDGDKPEDKGEGDDKKEPEKKDPPDTGKKEVAVRWGKTKYDFILERKQKQLEKAKAQKIADIDKELKDAGVEDDLDPEKEAEIEKIVDKKYWDQLEAFENQRFENEVNSFISSNEFAKLAQPAELERFKEYAQHPSRAQVPFDELIVSVMWPKRLMEIGAQREREAAKKAAASRVGGSASGKPGESKVDFTSMSDAEFEDYQNKIRQGRT